MRIEYNKLEQIHQEFGRYSIDQGLGCQDVSLRFGYWKKVNLSKLKEILGGSIVIELEDFYDEDCGYLYYYKLKSFL